MAVTHKRQIILLGFGKVGQELVRQVGAAQTRLQAQRGLQLTFTALADSQAMLYAPEGLTAHQIQTALAHKEGGGSLSTLPENQPLTALKAALQPGTILVDTSASTETLPLLFTVLENGGSVVLANKHPLSRPWSEARALFAHPGLRYESTVGAGLPVIASLRDLLATGDTVTAIHGCLSGTLGFLCTRLEQGAGYSAAVREAKELGYTEPDPRQDLSGLDVARKAVILARTAGLPLEMSELKIEKLYSDELAALSLEDFLAQMETLDTAFQQRLQPALITGKVPRYVASISAQKTVVGLEMVEKSSALGALQGPDNYIAFNTHRYTPNPLVIAGPGAGVQITAAGVFSDILHLATKCHYS